MSLPATLPPAPLAAIRNEEITGTRKITFSTRPPATGGDDFREFHFMVDNRLFDHHRVDHRIRLGAVEVNRQSRRGRSSRCIHQSVPRDAHQWSVLPEPIWRDTETCGAMAVTLRTRSDFTGRFVLHHILNHEDIGMMQLIEVYNTAL
jgi:hypothetical protein